MDIPTPPTNPKAGQNRGAPDKDDPPKSGFTVDGGADSGHTIPVVKDVGGAQGVAS